MQARVTQIAGTEDVSTASTYGDQRTITTGLLFHLICMKNCNCHIKIAVYLLVDIGYAFCSKSFVYDEMFIAHHEILLYYIYVYRRYESILEGRDYIHIN